MSTAAAVVASPSPDFVALLAELSRQAAATGEPSEFALQAVKSAAGLLKTSHFGWAEADSDGKRISVVVHANPQQPGPREGVCQYELDVDGGEGLFLEAVRLGRTVSVSDLPRSQLNDPRLSELGIAAALVVPMAGKDRAMGALAVFDGAPRSFDSEAQTALELLAQLASLAMRRAEAERDLSHHRAMLKSLSNSMESVMLVLSPDGRIAAANEACCSLTGFAADELLGRSVWSALMLPTELGEVKRAFGRIQNGDLIERFDSYLLTREGERRRVGWSITRLDGEERSKSSIVATGIDITDRCEAVERAVRAEAVAQSARQTLHELKHQLSSGEQSMTGSPAANRLPSGVEHDRRARARRDYPYVQRIAPLRDAQLPPESEFHELLCRDISSRGFSFHSPTPLTSDKVVVAFGTPPSVVYLTADVRHKTEKEINGRRQFVVGCRYTGRVSRKES